MARNTPEGKVKKQLLKILDDLGSDCFYYMPVQNGMGQTGIPDVMAIIHRVPFAFEVKATPKQHPTTRQAFALERIHKAGGFAFVVDNESVELVAEFLSNLDPDGDFSRYECDETEASHFAKPLYRWRKKLEVVEFGNE